jgi:hypothetical protein
LELLFLLRIGPWFTKNTLERTRETQCSPWAWGRRLWPNLGGSGGGFGRGRGREGRGAHHGSVCGRRWGGKALGGDLRRWPAVPAAGAPTPAWRTARLAHWRHGQVRGTVGKALGWFFGAATTRGQDLASAQHWPDWLLGGLCGNDWCATFIGRAQRRDADLNATVRRPSWLACAWDRRRTAGHLGADEYGTTRAPTWRARVPRRQAQRGTGCSCLEAVGPGPHGRWGGGTRSARRRDARQIAGALAVL